MTPLAGAPFKAAAKLAAGQPGNAEDVFSDIKLFRQHIKWSKNSRSLGVAVFSAPLAAKRGPWVYETEKLCRL